MNNAQLIPRSFQRRNKIHSDNEEVLVYLNRRTGEPVVRVQADTNGRFVMPAAWEAVKISGENTLIFVGQQSGAVVTTTFTVVP
ncbi:MAG: hypothetical protein ACJ8CB_01735 [Ktedonobacteraceae bacterium]